MTLVSARSMPQAVLVDTSVWSLALRRIHPVSNSVVTELAALSTTGRVVMLGPIRQEILSGVRVESQFERLRDQLRAFPDFDLTVEDFEEGAICFNRCRTAGIQGSNTDFLLCAVAIRHSLEVFTTDRDFVGYQRVLGFRLHSVEQD